MNATKLAVCVAAALLAAGTAPAADEPNAAATSAPAAAPAPAGQAQPVGGQFTFDVDQKWLKTITGESSARVTGPLPVVILEPDGRFSLEAGRLDKRNAKEYFTAWLDVSGRVDRKTGRILDIHMDANCQAGRIGGSYEVFHLFADPNMEVGTRKAGRDPAEGFVLTGMFRGPLGHTETMFADGGRGEGRRREEGRIEIRFRTQIRGRMLAKIFPPKPKVRPQPAWTPHALAGLGLLMLAAAVWSRRTRRGVPPRPAHRVVTAPLGSDRREGLSAEDDSLWSAVGWDDAAELFDEGNLDFLYFLYLAEAEDEEDLEFVLAGLTDDDVARLARQEAVRKLAWSDLIQAEPGETKLQAVQNGGDNHETH